MTTNHFLRVAEERRAIADLVAGLSDEQLRTPSLVPTWTVRDVAAHLALALDASIAQFLWAALTSGSIEKGTDKLTFARARRPISELVEVLRLKADSRRGPPGAGPEIVLTEVVVHGLDLRKPLGMARPLGEETLRAVLGVLFESPARQFVRPAWREGLRFEATDLAWTHGQGPLLKGKAEALILAVTGREAVLAELEGDGVAVLRQRFGQG